MTVWQGMFGWFAAVAMGGALMAAMIALRRPIPGWIGSGHGLFALAAVAALFVVNLLGEAATPALAWWALAVFLAGVIGGLLLFRVLFPQRAPLWLALGHGGVGGIGLDSIFIGTQLAFPLLAKAVKASPAGSASVVNVSSVFGQVAGFAQSAYCATKGAVRLLSKCQAVEFARAGSGVRVNSVHPGPGNTALAVNGVQQAIEAGIVDSPEALIGQLTALIPAGRFAEAEDVADLIHFLCSDASRYLTGSELTIDGGYTAG